MVDANSLIEGHCKFRDGKKWKTRWAVVTKLSPVADCLQLQIYRDEKERARNGHTKASLSLQAFLALESGFTLDKESHTLAIICQDVCVVLAFDNRERLIQWTVRIANNLGEGQQFLVQLASAPPKSKLSPGPVKLHVTDRKFCLTGGIPPRLLGHWEVPHLRRYGIVDGRLVFEGGSRCGKGEGVHVLVPDPPQISLIIDALDMSSKGQLVRGPSRRFGSTVTDSPRKSLSRLSELRSSSSASSTPNDPPVLTPVAIPAANMAIMGSTMSPTPRESRSAEALCNACNDPVNGQGGIGGSMWMSSEASSRCDLDSCDNVSVISPDEVGHDHIHAPLKHPASPARNPSQGQPLQIAKPLPSSMERCLSCMSKLGQQGQDILSPSWTMDLNVTSTNNVAPSSMSSSATSANNGMQGSIGSGNSDRLSISSHGSSSGVTEYYYDTPRSVLVAEARRTAAARSSTPPGVFQNGQMMHASNSNGGSGSSGGCSSPYRNPRSNHGCTANGFTSSVTSQQGAPCPSGCHCQNHPPRVMNSSVAAAAAAHGNSPIYYNGVAEQKAHGGKPPINLHPPGSTTGAGPYENYDFPRCTHPISFSPAGSGSHSSCGCCPSTGDHITCGHSNGIEWSKRPAMDRNSIASTAHGSDPASEFYDTPPRQHGCSCCAPPSCACCVPGTVPTGPNAAPHHHHHHHSHSPAQAQHSHYQNPASCIGHDPMENYDIPPAHPHGGILPLVAKDLQQQHSSAGIARSVNGEGKMPLVSGGSNAHAIYAQVDKTKKTPRSAMQQHFVNCDNNHQPIYENHHHHPNTNCQQQLLAQPTYANVEAPPCTGHVTGALPPKGKQPAPEPQTNRPSQACQRQVQIQHSQSNPANNYLNLEFTDSLTLYENAQEVRQEPIVAVVPPHKPETSVNSDGIKTSENLVKPTSEKNDTQSISDETKKGTLEELKVIPEEKEVETKENEYENTRPIAQEESKPILESQASEDSGKVEGNDTPSVQEEEMSVVSSVENAEVSPSTSGNTGKTENKNEEEPSLPLRRSSSVPCKGGHANRGSASSSDSGVSGDGGLFFEDSSPLNDIGSLCLHESLPRKSQRGSPNTSGRNTVTTPTSKLQEPDSSHVTFESAAKGGDNDTVTDSAGITDPMNRHYETIDESKSNVINSHEASLVNSHHPHHQPLSNPTVNAMKSGEICSVQQSRPKNPLTLVSDANSTSSGASDMSDYIETLSSCSRGSNETVTSIPVVNTITGASSGNVPINISVSPRKSSNMKPRSGKEYFKIDRSLFKND